MKEKNKTVISVVCIISCVQGLYAESHGIVANTFHDPEFNEMFHYGGRNLSDNRWWSGEPVCQSHTRSFTNIITMIRNSVKSLGPLTIFSGLPV